MMGVRIMNKLKVGILGGTFDPIHNGHLILAEHARMVFNLEKIIFIPTGRPPHKGEKDISLINCRYDMTLLATITNPYFCLSSVEIHRKGTTYTVDTIKYLQNKYENTEFYFILGTDSLLEIHRWKNYDELLKLCKFIVAERPDADNDKLQSKTKKLNEIYGDNIYVLKAPLIDISSTNIRNKVKSKESIKYLVPETVRYYIEKNGLYK